MKRLFHVCGFTVPRKAKVYSVPTPVALYRLHEDSSVTLLGIVNSVHIVRNRQGFALTKRDIRRLGNGSFDLAYKLCTYHKQSRLIAYQVPGDSETLAHAILECLQKTCAADSSELCWAPSAGFNRGVGLNWLLI